MGISYVFFCFFFVILKWQTLLLCLLLTIPLYISQGFNYLGYTLHLPSTQPSHIVYCTTKIRLVMKGTEVPNPRRSSARDCTCVLTRIDHCLVTLSCLPCALFCSCLCKVRSRISDALSQALSWFYCSHTFHSFLSQITLCFLFGSKDMIIAFTCLPSYSWTGLKHGTD